MSPFRVIAHRGASAQAPENTLAAFARAEALGVTEVETDVRKTSDGRLVLWHDNQLRPKVDRPGRAEDHALADLETLSLAPWFEGPGAAGLHPPGAGWTRVEVPSPDATTLLSLDAYLARFGPTFIHHVELKGDDPDLPDLTLAALRALRDRTVLTSFHFAHLTRARRLNPEIPLGYLCGRPDDAPETLRALLRDCLDANLQQICLHAHVCTQEIADAAHAAGLELRAWGIATRADMQGVLKAGADGMTINWPDALLAERAR
jgi:glycerophosphoryl diester phosphodiesterase